MHDADCQRPQKLYFFKKTVNHSLIILFLNDYKEAMSVKPELIIKVNTTHIKFHGVGH